MEKFKTFYSKNYHYFFIIPILLLIGGLFILAHNYSNTGDIINKDVTLKGGLTVTISTPKEAHDLDKTLKSKFPGGDFSVRVLSKFGTEKQEGILIEATNVDESQLKAQIEQILGIKLTKDNYSSEFMGSSLGDSFYREMGIAILLAFLFMAISVFLIFRTFVPSIAVVFAAFSDMVLTLAVLDLFHIKLSTSGIAAVLLLIGYSVDTDILLTTKALKRKDEGFLFERMIGAVKTGLTMTATTVVALTVGYFLTNSYVIKEMFLIIVIGLLIDVVNTYCMNAGLLWWYVRKKHNG